MRNWPAGTLLKTRFSSFGEQYSLVVEDLGGPKVKVVKWLAHSRRFTKPLWIPVKAIVRIGTPHDHGLWGKIQAKGRRR